MKISAVTNHSFGHSAKNLDNFSKKSLPKSVNEVNVLETSTRRNNASLCNVGEFSFCACCLA